MRHDPASGAIVIMLRSLKMHGMAQAVIELAADSDEAAPSFRFDRAPGFRDDLVPRDWSCAGTNCCHFVERLCQAFRW